MPTIVHHYVATIPTITLLKDNHLVTSLLRRMDEVQVPYEADTSGVHFTVSDDGEGYTVEFNDKISKPFSQKTLVVFTNLLKELLRKDMLQLVYRYTYDSSYSPHEWAEEEEIFDRIHKEAFYEGLFSHSL